MPHYQGQMSSKLPNMGSSIFSTMTQLANKNSALNLAQGFPDFSPDKELIKLCKKYFNGKNHQYAPMAGIPELRNTISRLAEHWYTQKYDPATEITIVPGATAGIYAALTALVKENDEVIIFEPNYDCYVPAIRLQGAKPVYVTLQHPEYKIDWDHVKRLVNFKTKAIIINTPNNPTSALFSADDMRHLAELTKNTDIWILSDEVYEHILFDGYEHQSVARYPRLAERSIIACSLGKTLHTTGWKLGYLLGPENLMTEIRKVYQYIIFSANTPLQMAINEYLETYEDRINLASLYGQKRDYFLQKIKKSRFKVLPCKGTYFALLDFSKISNEDDFEFAKKLTEQHKIASIPTSVFYRNKINNHALRFCFAKEEKTLKAAAEILCQV